MAENISFPNINKKQECELLQQEKHEHVNRVWHIFYFVDRYTKWWDGLILSFMCLNVENVHPIGIG